MSNLIEIIQACQNIHSPPKGACPTNVTDPLKKMEFLHNPSDEFKKTHMGTILTCYFSGVSELLQEMAKIETSPDEGDITSDMDDANTKKILRENLKEVHMQILCHPALEKYVLRSIVKCHKYLREREILSGKKLSSILALPFHSIRYEILYGRYILCMLVLISMEPFSEGEMKDPGYLKKSVWTKKQHYGMTDSILMSVDVWTSLTKILGRPN